MIRWAVIEDKSRWIPLAEEMAPIFEAPDMAVDPGFHKAIEGKLSNHEALIAVDRRTGECLGIIGFSRAHNSISWLGVFEKHRGKGAGRKLLQCALNQLDWIREITVDTFREESQAGLPARHLYRSFGFEDIDNTLVDRFNNPRCKMALPPSNKKKAGSFHHRYTEYASMVAPEGCPVCRSIKHPAPPVLLKELEYSWTECYQEAQGRLFGKCHVLSKKHSEHFYDLPKEDMANFMSEVQKVAKALHQVTGAVKINYELHGNSMPHLHVHLFPRYMDDDFPGAPIQYNLVEPCPYEDDEEFQWFVEKMRELL